MVNFTLLNLKTVGTGQSTVFKEIPSSNGLNGPRMLTSMFLTYHLAQKLEQNSTRLLLLNTSSLLKVSHTDITTSSSDGSIPQTKTGHLSFPKDSFQLFSQFLNNSSQALSTFSSHKPLTRDSEPRDLTSLTSQLKQLRSTNLLKILWLKLKRKVGYMKVLKMTANHTSALLSLPLCIKLLDSFPTLTDPNSPPRMSIPLTFMTLTSKDQLPALLLTQTNHSVKFSANIE